MIQYWSFWNFAGFLAYKYNYMDMNPALRTSIISVSAVGGFITYIYPRKLVFNLLGFKIKTPYYQMVIGDILLHQYPLYCLINSDRITNDFCGMYIVYPFSFWYWMIHRLKFKKDRIYGIKMNNLILSCLSIASICGIKYHYIQKIKNS